MSPALSNSKQLLLAILFALIVPVSVFAQAAPTDFSRQGIFGCSRNAAALSGSVGAFSATGGVFVPVADFTTELNTGTLVYQQCVLRGIVDREAEAATVADINKRIQFETAGNNGNAFFAVKPQKEMADFQDEDTLDFLQNPTYIQAMSPELASRIQRAEAQSYMQQRHSPQTRLKCTRDPNATGLNALNGDPACYDIGLYYIYDGMRADSNAACLDSIQNELNWGNGFYAVTQTQAGCDRTIQTPSIVNEEETVQALTSGFRRVETANDVDQMVGALYAGLGTQALTGSGGLLTGLTAPIGNNPSFLNRVTAESSAGLRNAAANAALQILAAARAVETQYNQTVSAIATNLTQTIGQLRSVESQCWGLIAFNTTTNHVCATDPAGGTSCTDAAGNNLRIATSTQFSQPIIDSQIAPIATQAVANIQKSQAALSQINLLIQGVSNTTSLDAQRLALVQLDQLVAQGKLHVQADVTAVQQQQTAVSDAMTQLVQQTKTQWADGTDATQAWCNVNNQAVIDLWDSKWR